MIIHLLPSCIQGHLQKLFKENLLTGSVLSCIEEYCSRCLVFPACILQENLSCAGYVGEGVTERGKGIKSRYMQEIILRLHE